MCSETELWTAGGRVFRLRHDGGLAAPTCFSKLIGVLLRKIAMDIFVQIGFVVLVGLACKNAILIVEFARQLRGEGKNRFEATKEACRLRLRPILMTSFAFILGCVPLWRATGSGAVARRVMGTTVIGGMLAATLLAVFLIPVTYYVIQRFDDRHKDTTPTTKVPDVVEAT